MTIGELKSFFRNPGQEISQTESFGSSIKLFFIIFGFNLLLSFFILSSLSGFLRIAFNIHFVTLDVNPKELLFLNIFFVPVVEEFAFRLQLKINKIAVSVSTFFITYIFISYLFETNYIDVYTDISYRLIISFVFFLIVFFVLMLNKEFESKLFKLLTKNYKLFFYSLLILFTLRHIDNFQINLITLLLLPLLLLPQFVSGFFMAYTRLKINFISAIIFHFLINLISFLPQLMYLSHGN